MYVQGVAKDSTFGAHRTILNVANALCKSLLDTCLEVVKEVLETPEV